MSLKTLETLADIKYQLLELLVDIGFVPINLSKHRHRSGQDIIFLLTGSEVLVTSSAMITLILM